MSSSPNNKHINSGHGRIFLLAILLLLVIMFKRRRRANSPNSPDRDSEMNVWKYGRDRTALCKSSYDDKHTKSDAIWQFL